MQVSAFKCPVSLVPKTFASVAPQDEDEDAGREPQPVSGQTLPFQLNMKMFSRFIYVRIFFSRPVLEPNISVAKNSGFAKRGLRQDKIGQL